MAVATTMAIIAASEASAAAASSRRAACTVLMQNYEPKQANKTEMRAYAECVSVLAPAPPSPGDVLAFKAVIVVCLLCGAYGAYAGYKSERKGDVPIAFMGFLGGVAAGMVLSGVVAAIAFVAGVGQ
jgi:hypothetical protein